MTKTTDKKIEEDVLKRIKEIRLKKGYSYENMAHDLDIAPSTYRKIEQQETTLTLRRLYQISEALKTKIEILLDLSPNNIYHQQITENGMGYQDIKHLYTENQEILQKLVGQYEQRIQEKDERIEFLKKQLDKYVD